MADQRGLYGKFQVRRTDGGSEPGGKHEHCAYFVLDLEHDKHALAALAGYAESCREERPALAADLDRIVSFTGPAGAFGPQSPAEVATFLIEEDAVRQEAARGPELVWSDNGEAGDGQNHCDGCGEEMDEPHTWEECHAALKERLDFADGEMWDTLGYLSTFVENAVLPSTAVRLLYTELLRRGVTLPIVLPKVVETHRWSTCDGQTGEMCVDCGIALQDDEADEKICHRYGERDEKPGDTATALLRELHEELVERADPTPRRKALLQRIETYLAMEPPKDPE